MSAIRRLFGSFRSARKTGKSTDAENRPSIQWAVVGLGNPGAEYARSRHNAGFMTVDRLGRRAGVEISRRRFKGLTADFSLDEKPAVLVKPQTFYNLSGECVADLLGYFKISAERLIVIHDEMDIEAGRLRIKQGGGDAGNRGVRGIAEALGTVEFLRVRIGVGRPPDGDASKDYLLQPMNRTELESFGSTLDRAANAVEAIAALGLEQAMNRFNQRV
ncbi:MAG TPA: aminoacyl-tRNA hydrolase [Candidatus Acidoferrales bacterium]|nr:aminoacyl-tRNA hydrolase [Candidatus Acidoferrales bacterium]